MILINADIDDDYIDNNDNHTYENTAYFWIVQ